MSLQINVKLREKKKIVKRKIIKKKTFKHQLISLLNTILIITQLFSIYFINKKKKSLVIL